MTLAQQTRAFLACNLSPLPALPLQIVVRITGAVLSAAMQESREPWRSQTVRRGDRLGVRAQRFSPGRSSRPEPCVWDLPLERTQRAPLKLWHCSLCDGIQPAG